MIPGGPLSRHMFVYSLIHFILCSIAFGTLKAAPDRDLVYIECGPLTFTVYLILFIRANYIPVIVAACMLCKTITRYALMIDAYIVTIILCMEFFVSAVHLTQAKCYQSLKTDPDQGTAIFVNAMGIVIAIDTSRLVYFICSREETQQSRSLPGDDEIELLLKEIDDAPVLTTDEEEEMMTRKRPTKPPAIAPCFGRVEGT